MANTNKTTRSTPGKGKPNIKAPGKPRVGRAKTAPVNHVDPKRHGAINELGVLHDDVMRSLAAVGRKLELVERKLTEFVLDAYVHGSTFYPQWTQEDRENHVRFVKDLKDTMAVVSAYNWHIDNSPHIKAEDAWKLHRVYCRPYSYETLEANNKHYEFWCAVAEITGFQKAKLQEDHIDSTRIAETFEVRELITDILYEFREAEDEGRYIMRRERTEAVMSGNYMDDGSHETIKDGDVLQLSHIDWHQRSSRLKPGQIVAIDSEREEGKQRKSFFSVGRLVAYDVELEGKRIIRLKYCNGQTVTLGLFEAKAIYLVAVQSR